MLAKVDLRIALQDHVLDVAPGYAVALNKSGQWKEWLEESAENAWSEWKILTANLPENDLNGRQMAREVVLAHLLELPPGTHP